MAGNRCGQGVVVTVKPLVPLQEHFGSRVVVYTLFTEVLPSANDDARKNYSSS